MLSAIPVVAMTPFAIASIDINVRTHFERNDMERIKQHDALYVHGIVSNELIVAIIENNG